MAVEVKDASGQTLHFYDIDGYLVPAFYLQKEEIKKIVTSLPNFICRKNDIMLCTYPKTGTNWVYEIIMMMLRGSSERIPFNKIQTMMEIQKREMIDDQPPPRVLNTHLLPRFLPKDLVSKQIKTVLVVRNPKDTAVSYYNHMTGMKIYKYSGKWKDWLPLYMHGKLEYGRYSAYLQEWERIIEGGAKFPLHVVYYEDLHQNCLEEVKRLAKFLNIRVPEELIIAIIKMCRFDKMADEKFHPTVKRLIFEDHFKFFRKGKVGDWKNWFTVEQSMEYDEQWATEMKDSRF